MRRAGPGLAAAAVLMLAAMAPRVLAMPDTLGRPLWREVVSTSPSPSPPPERWRNKNEALSRGARRARARGKYKADALQDPQHWIRGEDPAHPNMRIPVDVQEAHSVNVLPENSFWKDHDSDQDEGHPNFPVERLMPMDSEELSADMDRTMEAAGFDLRAWSDANYPATIRKYNLQDIEKAKYLCPKMYYEPRGSSEEEDFAEMLLDQGRATSKVPSMDEPFCMHCESMLGAPVPSQGLLELSHDPRCRKCGFMNPHAPDGTLMTHGQVDLVELQPSKLFHEEQAVAAEKYFSNLDELEQGQANTRPTTEQRCEECGWKMAYYWAAQVRGADEGQTAFFECVRCHNVWNIK